MTVTLAQHTVVTRHELPDAGVFEFERRAVGGGLAAIRGGGRDYLVTGPGWAQWPGMCTVREFRDADTLTRRVRTDAESWSEEYRWRDGRLTEVDGVLLHRDAHGRVLACLDMAGRPGVGRSRWFYTHDDHGVARIAGPFGDRWVRHDQHGRPISVTQAGGAEPIHYGPDGARIGARRPDTDHVDEAGRTWVTRDAGRTTVYLWDGMRCLARIDGVAGDPLAAVFSLDPSGTPVRVIHPDGHATRIPRDLYGESLREYPGVPGLFGGRRHGGLVHLPLRRLDPATGSFCEPDPFDGADTDPRRAGGYDGPLPVEAASRSAYEVCRGDAIGRADPTGGISAGLVISDITWSLQNNLLTFFGIDWFFNLWMSLVTGNGGFFDSTGLMASDRHGGFGIRRDGFVAALSTDAAGDPRVFTTQHLVWSPDSEFADLDTGEVVVAPGLALTHYGTVLALTPTGQPRTLLQSMNLAGLAWTTAVPTSWARAGGVGVAVAPGARSAHFPNGGLHLDMALPTRGDTACAVAEIGPGPAAIGTLTDRSFLTAPSITTLAVGDLALIEDGATLAEADVIGAAAVGGRHRIQLATQLTGLSAAGLSVTELDRTPASTETHNAGPLADALDLSGAAAVYTRGDLLRVTTGADVTLAVVDRAEAQIPIDRPLPGGDTTSPTVITLGVVGAAAQVVTINGAVVEFGSSTRPGVGSTGLLSGGGVDIAVRVTAEAGGNGVEVDAGLPAALTGAAAITYRALTMGAAVGRRDDPVEGGNDLTYRPEPGVRAPDGSSGTVVVRCDIGVETHVRTVTGAPNYDVIVLDRAVAGAAPYTVERLTRAGARVGGVSRNDVMALVVPDPAPFATAAAVHLTRTGGAPPAPAVVALTGDVTAGTIPVPAVATVITNTAGDPLQPGRPVVVGAAATGYRAAAIAALRVTPTFDRAIDFGGGTLRLVALAGDGRQYLGQVDGEQIVVEPTIELVAGTPIPVPFPRFEVGDIVCVADRPGGGNTTWHRVASVSGGRLGLEAGPSLAAAARTDVTVQAVVTTDPGNGSPYLGIDGARTGAGPVNTADFSVWRFDTIVSGQVVGIVDGELTHPAVVTAAALTGEIRFSEAFDAVAADVATIATLADRWAPALGRDEAVLLLDGAVGTLRTVAGESIVAVAYSNATGAVDGLVGAATLLVPEGEDTEVTRAQALIDHELTHTLQYAKFGPLWFNIFPMLALELPGILASDVELPEFSRFLDASTEVGTANRINVMIPNTAGVPLAVGDEIQIVQGARHARAVIRAVTGAAYGVTANNGLATIPIGAVSVRKCHGGSVFDGFYNVLDLLTHGGLLNVIAGTTWGGLFWLIGKGFYGLGRAIGGTGDLYPATVQAGGATITVKNAADGYKLGVSGKVVVRQGESTVVRSMTSAGTLITLGEPVPFTGDVQVAMYDRHDPDSAFDWFRYYPAEVDPANPFVLTVAPAEGASLSVRAEDRVKLRYRDRDWRATVMSVNGAQVQLDEPIDVIGGERSVRIAAIGPNDPLGRWDEAAMTELGMGWMKWLFDPYGQIEYAVNPDAEWARWLLRVVRWLVGTQNFSLLPFGYAWWFRLFREAESHKMFMEQEASQESGDLYSPLGRMFGGVEDDEWATKKMVVGDVARYRFWHGDRTARNMNGTLLDATGPASAALPSSVQLIRTMPNRVGGGASDPPNQDNVVGPTADPGTFVSEVFAVHDADPRVVPGGDVIGFAANVLGEVPVGARGEQMSSAYAAFTRPGSHRLTTVNNSTFDLSGAAKAVQASAVGQFDIFHGGQTLFYDITVDDVDVRVGSQPVNGNDPAAPDLVSLIPFQQVSVLVTPNGSRVYRVSVPDPDSGEVGVADRALTPRRATTAPIPVEVSRFYQVSDDGSYGSGGLAFAGMHLSRSVDIPVRRFQAEVLTSVPLRAAAQASDPPIGTLARAVRGFILVPAPILNPPAVTTVAGVPPAADAPDPVSRADAPAEAGFLGLGGAAFAIEFPADAPAGPVVLTVRVGVGADFADLTCSFDLT